MEILFYLLALVSGMLAGFAGIFPFVHSNSLATIFGSLFNNPLQAGIFFAALGAAHIVFTSFPAVFFGLPSAGQSVSVLPAHSLAMAGRGLEALHAMFYALFAALVLALAFSPALYFFASAAYPLLANFTLPILLAVVALFFFSEKSWGKMAGGFALFVLSGVFGFIVLSFSFVADPLLPLLTGLFGLPLLILSFSSSAPPRQQIRLQVPFVSNVHVAAGVLLGAASTFVPAASPAVISSAAFLAFGESTPLGFLALSSAISASKAVFDVESVFSIGKARSGVASAISRALSGFGEHWLFLVAVGAAGFCALAVALKLSQPAASLFSSLPQRKVSTLFLLVGMLWVFLSGGVFGVSIAVVACAIGLLAPLAGIRHAYLTGALLIPTILYYSGFSHHFLSLLLQLR